MSLLVLLAPRLSSGTVQHNERVPQRPESGARATTAHPAAAARLTPSAPPVFACRRRCYPIWMDFSECMSQAEDPKSCKDFRDDYLECLHHRKEVRCQGLESGGRHVGAGGAHAAVQQLRVYTQQSDAAATLAAQRSGVAAAAPHAGARSPGRRSRSNESPSPGNKSTSHAHPPCIPLAVHQAQPAVPGREAAAGRRRQRRHRPRRRRALAGWRSRLPAWASNA